MLPIAVDAMGGDFAPAEIVKGAQQAAAEGVDVLLFGDPEQIKFDPVGAATLDLVATGEVIAMHEDPGPAVRTKKDASVVRAAQAVKTGQASAVVSAGNTGAVMAASVLRMGRLSKVARPAIAIPFPVYGRDQPNLLLDCGANADCQPQWLLQFACMGAVHARDRFGVRRPRIGLLSIGEEASKGSALAKEAHTLLAEKGWQEKVDCRFVGNVEGRDLLEQTADVIVTDGFTGNVMLKTAEGVARRLVDAVLSTLDSSDELRRAAQVLLPALSPLYQAWNPDNTGGGVLLGVSGVSVISHGSSGATAIKTAICMAQELVERQTISHLEKALASVG